MPDLHDQYAGKGGCYMVGEDGNRIRVPYEAESPALIPDGKPPLAQALDPGKAGRSQLRGRREPAGDERDPLHESGDHPTGG